MFTSDEWKQCRWAKLTKAKEVKNIILKSDFWAKAADIIKVQEPLVKVLRLVDGDEKPTMGFIYEALDRAKLAIQRDCRYWKDYWKIIDKRWTFQLHQDLHTAGYYLNPQFQYGEALTNNPEVLEGVKEVIQRLEPLIDNQIKAINQILSFRDKQDSFGTVLAQRAVLRTNPAEWWIHYGTSAPELQRIAVRVLSQTSSSSNCERNWSTFGLIHTKTRNRLKWQKLNKLVYVYYNMRLKIRNATRRSQQEIEDNFNPINLDYIFDEDDPLAPWLEEREAAVLDGQDNSDWLNLDDDGNDQDGAATAIQVPSGSESGSAGGGLSPPSGHNSDSGTGGGENFEAGGGSCSPYNGEYGFHGFHDDEEIGEPSEMQPLAWGRRRPRQRSHPQPQPSNVVDPSIGIMDQFGVLGLGGHSQSQLITPLDPPSYPPQPQYYYPPQYYPPQPTPQSYPHGYLVLPIPQGYFGQQERVRESSSSQGYFGHQQEESSNSNNYNYGMGVINNLFGQTSSGQDTNDDLDIDNEPPRHSFWW